MRAIAIILLFFTINLCASAQVLSLDDLIEMTGQSAKTIEKSLDRKKFAELDAANQYQDLGSVSYEKKIDSVFYQLRFYKEGKSSYISLLTNKNDEFEKDYKKLQDEGFLKRIDTSLQPAFTFQRRNVTIQTTTITGDSTVNYNYLVERKEMPEFPTITVAEDLLKFSSHDYLEAFFGKTNVVKDLYYFSEKELKKCTVLFPNSPKQAVFIWNDEALYSDLSYILISGIMPTVGAAKNTSYVSQIPQNRWQSKDGLYASMSLLELLQMNGKDFYFYGKNSQYAYMIAPESDGSIDFRKTGLMLGCVNSSTYPLLSREKVSAMAAIEAGIPLYVFYIMVNK